MDPSWAIEDYSHGMPLMIVSSHRCESDTLASTMFLHKAGQAVVGRSGGQRCLCPLSSAKGGHMFPERIRMMLGKKHYSFYKCFLGLGH